MGEPGGVDFAAPEPLLALYADWAMTEGGIIFAPTESHYLRVRWQSGEDLLSMSQGTGVERAFRDPANVGPKREGGR